MCHKQVQKLTASLQKLQNASKDTRDALTAEVNIAQKNKEMLLYSRITTENGNPIPDQSLVISKVHLNVPHLFVTCEKIYSF